MFVMFLLIIDILHGRGHFESLCRVKAHFGNLEFVARLSCSKGLSLSYYKYSEEDETFIELE